MTKRTLLRRLGKSGKAVKLVVGLGNPGQKHAKNRHNVGFQVVDRIAAKYDLAFDRIESQALRAGGEIAEHEVILLKPLTYMNESGKAVKPAMGQHHIAVEDILIVYDDLDLPLGTVRIRQRGGSGGHKGMRSIIGSLGTERIARLRIGIGRPAAGSPEEYVLQDFSLEESIIMEEAYRQAVASVECILEEGISKAMDRHN